MNDDQYQLIERVPTLDEYRVVCTAVGWAPVINFNAAKTALPNSLFGVVVTHQGRVVGMGRIVGDGAIFFYLQDIAVLPEHQGKGLGTLILEALMRYVRQNAPPLSFVGLFAAAGTQPFYRRFGFTVYPELTGMYQNT